MKLPKGRKLSSSLFRDLPHRQPEPAALPGAAARGRRQRRPVLRAGLRDGLGGDGGAARGQRRCCGCAQDEAVEEVLRRQLIELGKREGREARRTKVEFTRYPQRDISILR